MSGEELRALAEAANNAWHAEWSSGTLGWSEHFGTTYRIESPGYLVLAEAVTEELADFIAAANPTAVLALLDERDALRAQVDRARALADIWAEGHWRGAERELRYALDGPPESALDGPQ